MMSIKLIPLLLLLLVYGCATSVDTANMQADDRLKYAMELYNDESYDLAIVEFEAILLQYPGSEVIDDAQYYLGMCRFNRNEFLLAGYEFSKLISNIAASQYVADAQFMLAECYYQLSPHYSLDQKFTRKAIMEFQAFIDFFPTNDKVQECERKIKELNSKLALKEYSAATIYRKMEFYTAAILAYENVIELFHDTEFAPLASYNKILLLIERNQKADAQKEINNFLMRYPENENAAEIKALQKSLL